MPEIQPPCPIAMLTRKANRWGSDPRQPRPLQTEAPAYWVTNLRSGKNHPRHRIVRLKTDSYRVHPLRLIYTATAWKRESMGSITLMPLTNLLFKKKYSYLSVSLSAEKVQRMGVSRHSKRGKKRPSVGKVLRLLLSPALSHSYAVKEGCGLYGNSSPSHAEVWYKLIENHDL